MSKPIFSDTEPSAGGTGEATGRRTSPLPKQGIRPSSQLPDRKPEVCETLSRKPEVCETVSRKPGKTTLRPSDFSKDGLTAEAVKQSHQTYGKNTVTRQAGKSFVRCFLGNLNDPVIRILLGALGVQLLTLFRGGNVTECLGIACAVFLATFISTLSERSSDAAFQRLEAENRRYLCKVRRNGAVTEVPSSELAVGDVVLLSAGDPIPADGLLLRGELDADQSPLTGESREIHKRPSQNPSTELSAPSSLPGGCTVLSGSGEMGITAVGDATYLGKISKEVQAEQRQSPLKVRLTKLAKQISRLGYLAAALAAFAYLFHVFVLDSGMRWEVISLKLSDPAYLFSKLFHAFTLGLTVLVVAVPEGLPMMIAVVLSANLKRMVKDQVLVRKPVGIEAAGSMNILFTDKTGTLTKGKMKLTGLIFPRRAEKNRPDSREVYQSQSRRRAEKDPLLCGGVEEAGELFGALLNLCFRGSDAKTAVSDDGKSRFAVGGNATDRALLESVLGLEALKESKIQSRLPFDSRRKYSAVTCTARLPCPDSFRREQLSPKHPETSAVGYPEQLSPRRPGISFQDSCRTSLTFVVGAPELLLPYSSLALSEDGSLFRFQPSEAIGEIQNCTRNGCRCVAVLLSQEGVPASELKNGIRGSLIYLCTVCLSDPVRKEAPLAVRSLSEAGIQTVMVTGDSRETACSIAEQCGLLTPERNLILTGEELRGLSDAALKADLPKLAAVARALPTDKSRLVRAAQETGLVVGMTGDGINDAPALRLSDIGFSMGSGTQVAKDAGDIVILDNNLSSIVKAVLYGRTVFKSIRKFITLQLTMNFSAVGVTVICPFLGIDSPVTVVQMLWINLIMDTLGGIAFAGEAPLPDYMKEPPKKREENILNRYTVHEIAWLGGFTVALCLFFLTCPLISCRFRPHKQNLYLLTAFFALFIFTSVWNCFLVRSDRIKLWAGLGKNPVFIGIMAAVLTVQILFVYLGGAVLRTAPLTPSELFLTLLISLSTAPFEWIRRVCYRWIYGRNGY